MLPVRLSCLSLLLAMQLSKASAQGNHVAAGAEATNFGTIDLATPGGQTWSTARSATPGYFSCFGASSAFSNASDAANVNGYVKRYGSAGSFPVGTGSDLRSLTMGTPEAASESYAAAWILGHPKTTADPTNGGAFHDTASVAGTIKRVMSVGQWDWQSLGTPISQPFTVTASMPNLSAFAPKGHLRLVGWQNSTGKWIDLSGAYNATGNTEDATVSGTMVNGIDAIGIGSIANGFPDVNPGTDIDNTSFTATPTLQARDFLIYGFEVANNPTDGSTTTTIRITKPSGWTISVPGITLSATDQSGVSGTSDVGGGTANENGRCYFRENTGFVIITLKPGEIIPGNGLITIGLTATRKAGLVSGTSQNATVSFVTNSGGDITTPNNTSFINFTAN